MSNFFNKPDIGILFFRILTGTFATLRGIQVFMQGKGALVKLGKATSCIGIHFSPFTWGILAALIFTIGGIFMLLGVFFRPVCALMLCVSAIGCLYLFNTNNHLFATFDLLFALTTLFLSFLFIGPGKYSLSKS